MTISAFSPGQRWVSDAEPDLGLGLVLESDSRVVRLVYPATGEERAYAIRGAPLSRLRFSASELARSDQGWAVKVDEVAEHDGLLIYAGTRLDTGEPETLIETRLAHDLQINQPRDRLFAGQFDSNRWFELRYASLRHRAELEQSEARGLMGPRVAPIPHQLYIAHEVANRYAPRVLLADEVGLGKTIEAGLILHHQLLTERAQRALIIVPEALTSQWVLELLRRFNLNAAIFDDERCAEAESSTGDNPFSSEQLVLCSLDFLLAHPERAGQAAEAGWDLMIVDEAHHLRWSEDPSDPVSPEYQLVERLARAIPGLLLLTATPEQLGHASHFARLRLLDPDRFTDLDSFVEEEKHYAQTAREVDVLLEKGDESHLQELLDRHGTGRVLFRNTRASVQGFPGREVHPHPLPSPYPGVELYPELDAAPDWVESDPRVEWLVSWLKGHHDKVLVICAHKTTAIALENYLNFNKGVRSAAFHEDLGLLARDRAAAWFGQEGGAQALICSEMGSEGRNFQFAHQLVLFDLPGEPDLLEQRIGRLDRIGQQDRIYIHVPYFADTAQAVLFEWFHQGLDAFESTCPAGSRLREMFGQELERLMGAPQRGPLDELIRESRQQLEQINRELEAGHDRLLELSSCRPEAAEALAESLRRDNDSEELMQYLQQACDCFGIDVDYHSEHSSILRPGTGYQGGFKDISLEGTTVTADRDTALTHEDYKFLSWEHPLITEAMDRVLGGPAGNTTVGILQGGPFAAGTLLLECLFQVQAVAPRSLQLGRYLPPRLFRIVVDNRLEYCSKKLPFATLIGQVQKVGLDRVKPLLKGHKALLDTMLSAAQKFVEPAREDAQRAARERVEQYLVPELERLRYLQSINPAVREAEIEHLESQLRQLNQVIDSAAIGLTGVRVLITA